MSAPDKLQRLDFKAINEVLLANVESYAAQWFGGGKRVNHEFQAPSTSSGGIGDSWSVNVKSGVWSHFAGGQSGGDLISLYAEIHGLSQIEAGKQLAEVTGCKPHYTSPASYAAPQATMRAASSAAQSESKKETKETKETRGILICPVPADAPVPHVAHSHRGKPAMRWTYFDGDAVLGYVFRFVTSDGGKETLPHTYWQNPATGAAAWEWRVWPEPRPIYRPTKHTLVGGRAVIVVEGEKCAYNLDAFLLENGCTDFDVVSWVGGSGAVKKIDWQPLAGRKCILWPDADCKRTKDGAEYLPVAAQPGQKCMDAIAQVLLGLGCAVSMVPLPDVGTLADGWDCADAIAGGWDLARVLAFMGSAQVVLMEADGKSAGKKFEAGLTQGSDLADGLHGDGVGDWRSQLVVNGAGNPKPTRENVSDVLSNDPALSGMAKYNEFSNRVDVVQDLPWRKRAVGSAKMSEWDDADSLQLGQYLCRQYGFPSIGAITLHEGVALYAATHAYHPIRDGFNKLVWDKVSRLDDWLLRCVCANPESLSASEREYIALVGRYFIMGAVARILDPGCKFDYCFVLKGKQGVRKSTLFSVLGGAYFSDSQFKLDDPANMGLAIAGRWFIEFAEMVGFNRSELNNVKACLSQQVDRYRSPFAKTVKDHPRQCVFCGSTNDDTPLRDPTGARRFWVVEVTRNFIDTDYLQSVRFQLFAEALEAIKAKQVYYPSYEQETRLFKPQQDRHTRATPIFEQIAHLTGNGVGDWATKHQWTTAEIGMKLTSKGVDAVTASMQQEIGAAMRKLGWQVKQKRLAGKVVRVYEKPENWGAVIADRESESEPSKAPTGVSPTSPYSYGGGDDDMPF